MTKPNHKAQTVIDTIRYATIATVDMNGQPWNTVVAISRFDGDYALYWASWIDNQHSKNIRANGKAFVVIYDSTPSGNQPGIQAEASELTDEQEVMQAALVFKNDPYNPSDGQEYLGDKPRRIYKVEPQRIWTNGDSEINGNFIDVRIGAEQ